MRVREQLVSLDDDDSEMNELDFSNTYCLLNNPLHG